MGRFSLRVKSDEERERFINILMDEDIGIHLFKDFNSIKGNFDFLKNENLILYLLVDDEKDVGIGAILRYPAIKKAVVDVGAKKEERGIKIKKGAEEALQDFFNEFNEYDLFAFVKKENKPSLYFAQRVGLKLFNKVHNNYILRYTNGQSKPSI